MNPLFLFSKENIKLYEENVAIRNKLSKMKKLVIGSNIQVHETKVEFFKWQKRLQNVPNFQLPKWNILSEEVKVVKETPKVHQRSGVIT